MKTIALMDSLLYQLVVLLFECPLFCRVSEQHGKKCTRLAEILVGGVTSSVPNGAEFAEFTAFKAFTSCLTFVWFPRVYRVKHSVSIVSIVCLPFIVRFVSNVYPLSFVPFGTFSPYCSFRFERLVSIVRFVSNECIRTMYMSCGFKTSSQNYFTI